MLIQTGYDISVTTASPTLVLAMLEIHPSRQPDVVAGSASFACTPATVQVQRYRDALGNRCLRLQVPQGVSQIHLRGRAVVRDDGLPDVQAPQARQTPVHLLPAEVLAFLLPSRYCDFDGELLQFAWRQFGSTPEGWARVKAICDYVHHHIRFDYMQARANRTATQGWKERVGVCRDFAHLAVALCRAMNIPARYATGYLGDIAAPASSSPMDLSAWMEVWLDGHWYTFDARFNVPRVGRVLLAHGRDAADVPITMLFGASELRQFDILTEELDSVDMPAPVASGAHAASGQAPGAQRA